MGADAQARTLDRCTLMRARGRPTKLSEPLRRRALHDPRRRCNMDGSAARARSGARAAGRASGYCKPFPRLGDSIPPLLNFMKIKSGLFLFLALLFPALAAAQLPSNASLAGDYYFVHLLISGPGTPDEARLLGGVMTFDGAGGYTFTGQLGVRDGTPAASGGSGSYEVDSSGFLVLDNPIDGALQINGRMSRAAQQVTGASTEAVEGTYDLFFALRAPQTAVSDATLSGEYTGAALRFEGATLFDVRTSLLSMTAGGEGSFVGATAVGHSFLAGDQNVAEAIDGATYALNSDGTGVAEFGASSSLFGGSHDVFVSGDGNFFIGYLNEAGARQVFIAIRNLGGVADDEDFRGNFWMTEVINVPSADPATASHTAATGALRSNRDGTAVISQRVRVDLEPVDFSGINFYRIDADSRGLLAGFTDPDAVNMAIGAAVNGRADAFIGAQVDAPGFVTNEHGIFLGVRTPSLSGQGVFLNPLGVANGASFAPPAYPVSPGSIVTLFGSFGPADLRRVATTVPLTTELGGVSATVNGVPAPLFFVSGAQINLQIPFSAAEGGGESSPGILGPAVRIRVTSDGEASNTVAVPLAPTSPGIFSVNSTGLGVGTVTDADFRQINADNPAAPGETVLIFLTGLGALDPPVPDGAAGPTDPLSETVRPVDVYFGVDANNEPLGGDVLFSGAAPNFVGLYQVNVTIPESVVTGPPVPVLVRTPNMTTPDGSGLTDLVEIPVEP